MRTGRFISRITVCVSVALIGLPLFSCKVRAFSGEDVYGGANGLVKDAIEVIKSRSEAEESKEASFDMDIEPVVERDLSGTIMEGIYVDDINLSGKTYDDRSILRRPRRSPRRAGRGRTGFSRAAFR